MFLPERKLLPELYHQGAQSGEGESQGAAGAGRPVGWAPLQLPGGGL